MNQESKAHKLEKEHKPFSKQWDCYNDQPDQEHNETKSAIVTARSIISALNLNKVANASTILYYRGVLRILVRKLGKLEFEKTKRMTKKA